MPKINPPALIPESVLPILQSSPIFSKSERLMEKAILFVSILTLKIMTYKYSDKKLKYLTKFVSMNSRKLRILISTKNYIKVLNELQRLGIIDVYDKYQIGSYSKSYRIKPSLLNKNLITINYRMPGTTKSYQKYIELTYTDLYAEYPYLLTVIENIENHIFFDDVNALKFIECQTYANIEQRIHRVNVIKSIKLGYSHNSISKSNGRFFHKYTSLPRELRQYLYIINPITLNRNYVKLEIDASNCQVVMLCLTLMEHNLPIDDTFANSAFSGNIYEDIAKFCSIERDEVKNGLIKALLFTKDSGLYLLSKKNLSDTDKINKSIVEFVMLSYPIFWKSLNQLKIQYRVSDVPTTNIYNKEGSLLALATQRKESEIFIHKTIPNIGKDLLYLPIHDSIMIFNWSIDDFDEIEEIIKESAIKVVGRAIPLKSKIVGRQWFNTQSSTPPIHQSIYDINNM